MARSPLLVTGGTGLLGKALAASVPPEVQAYWTHLRDLPASVASSRFTRLDVADRESVFRLFAELRPAAVVHAAAMGNVDFAEQNREAAWQVNVGATQNIVDACRDYGARLIYLSSNAVFDGDHPPYDEASPRHPVNSYGQLKVEAEDLVLASGLSWALVRPILMYGWPYPHGRDNPVTTWIRQLGAGQPVNAVDDRYWRPLYVGDCATLVWSLLQRQREGVFHIAGPERLTMEEFARETARVFHLEERLIQPVHSDFFPALAPRPVDTSFDLTKLQREVGLQTLAPAVALRAMQASREAACSS